jgi:phage terminase large subunit
MSEQVTEVVHEYTPHGAARELWNLQANELLMEGPAGTGKTRALLEYINFLCERYAGIRCLLLRQTRESLTESVLVTFEQDVLWENHPAIHGTSSRNTRQNYHYPNGSHIVVGGLDKPAKTFSTQYDVIAVFEAREITADTWEWLARPNRNFKMPWQMRVADTNPAGEFHWLNTHFPQGFREVPDRHRQDKRVRLLSRHEDNPSYFDHKKGTWTKNGEAYVLGILAKLTGARRANLYEGKWASEEGIIYEDWDPAVHMVDFEDMPEPKWYFGAYDKGLRHPGCLQIWAVNDDRMYRVLEIYKTGENSDWWAEQVLEANEDYPLSALVCDPSEPEYIRLFNDRLGSARGRDGNRIARKARNPIRSGIDMVRWGLSKVDNGPRIYICRGSQLVQDKARIDAKKPTCLEEEIPSYVWAKSRDGAPIKERPDPTCSDHAMDCLRYAAMFMWNRDMSMEVSIPEYPDGSLGDLLGHSDVHAEVYS